MSDDEQEPSSPGFVQFRMQCPNCSQGVRTRARMGIRSSVRHEGENIVAVGTSFVPETCADCDGDGWLPLGSGEWKRRPKSAPDTAS
ncbi:hypothetical protein [Kitasatospora sp. GAS204B]|uniref:hypothetical protein n=1 Tax=unclassified Kitasatospora TaxID=2633591 RepID=UPI002476F72D|nr:hypothetical protein [Kitasatospora sp. GAS204B]MDH6115708.1 hypothetical protein [Kitasatospora sp. GAS204B]